ncbi:hypothetical protein [Microlunatus flavus]|uniref:hypothetical protein n=1 Tax=Microlunatus flavus TaxID=1036181 RepID=UPI0011137C10|nr:hypothetical protein [Microlunatus flavus]
MPGADGARRLAETMFAEALAAGQSTRAVADDAVADEVRQALRDLGRTADVRLRTARMNDLVVVARLDAAIWTDDTATMRAKLTPPS